MKRAGIITIVCICISLLLLGGFFIRKNGLFSVPPESQEEPEILEAWFIDVGEGSAAVFRCGGQTMIVDGGASDQSDKVYSFLKSHGISYLDYVVGTHPDADHVGGLSGALTYADAGKVFCTVTEHDSRAFRNFAKNAEKRKAPISIPEPGDCFLLGGASVTVLAPEPGIVRTDNTSIVLKITHGNVSFLLMGDSEKQDENALLSAGWDLESTVLLVGHHGSASSTYRRFVAAVKPRYGVISVGENSFGHPSQYVLRNLTESGAEILRTDELGTILMTSDGKSVVYAGEK